MNRSLFFRSSWQLVYFTVMNLIILTPIAFLFRVGHLKSFEFSDLFFNFLVLLYILLSLNAFISVLFFPLVGLAADFLILPKTLFRKEKHVAFEDIEIISESKNLLFPHVVLNIKRKKHSIPLKRKQVDIFINKLKELKSLKGR